MATFLNFSQHTSIFKSSGLISPIGHLWRQVLYTSQIRKYYHPLSQIDKNLVAGCLPIVSGLNTPSAVNFRGATYPGASSAPPCPPRPRRPSAPAVTEQMEWHTQWWHSELLIVFSKCTMYCDSKGKVWGRLPVWGHEAVGVESGHLNPGLYQAELGAQQRFSYLEISCWFFSALHVVFVSLEHQFVNCQSRKTYRINTM